MKVAICCCLDCPLLAIFHQPHILEPLVDIKAKVAPFVEMMPPFVNEFPLSMLCLNCKIDKERIVFNCFLPGVSHPNGDKSFHEWLQVSSFHALDIRSFPFDIIYRIISAQASVCKFAHPDVNGVEEGCRC